MPQYQLDYVCCIFFFLSATRGNTVGCRVWRSVRRRWQQYIVCSITYHSILYLYHTLLLFSLSLSVSLFMYISLSLSLSSAVFSAVLCVYSECVSAQSTGHSQYILSHSRQQNEQHTIKHKTQTLARRIRKTIQRESNDWRISLAR